MLDQGQDTLADSIRAAANSAGAEPGICRNCHGKSGLAILPLGYSPAPRAIFDWLKDDASAIASLQRMDDALLANDQAATWYYPRSLPSGYLYILKEDKTWDAYVVGSDGMLNRLPVDSLPSDSSEAALEACRREGHSPVNPRFFCLDPDVDKIVWVAFSRHRWSDVVRKRYEDDTDGCRSGRMTQLDVEAAAKYQVGSGREVPFGAVVSAERLRGVADFTDKDFQDKLHAFTGHAVLSLGGQREALAHAMATASAKTDLSHGVLIVLQDGIGVAEEHNLLRTHAVQKYQDWQAGGPTVDGSGADPLRAWKRQSATHVAYIEGWVEQRGTRAGENTASNMRAMSEKAHETELAPYVTMTEAEFNRRHGRRVNEPLRGPSGGLNPWSGAKWVPTGTMTERPASPDIYDYDARWQSEPLGYVEYADEYWDALAEYHGGHITRRQLQRYRKRLDVEALTRFNTEYAAQDAAWCEHIEALDEDYVAFAQGHWPTVVLEHDFDDTTQLVAGSRLQAVNDKLSDVVARLVSTEKVFGGGAVSQASLDMLTGLFGKDPASPDNWIAAAVLGEFKLLDAATQPGNVSSFYSGIIGGTQLPAEWWSQFERYRASASAASQNLLAAMQQVAGQQRVAALQGAAGQGIVAVADTLAEINAREIVWVRAAALWEFLSTRSEHYSINVQFKAGEYLDALAAGSATSAGVLVMEGRERGDRTRARANRHGTRKVLNKLSRHPQLQGNITVPLVVEKSALQAATGRGGMAEVYNIGQAQGVARMPRDAAEALLRTPTVWQERRWSALINREAGFSGFAVVLSGWQLWQAIEALGRTSGFQYADAVASLMGGATGVLGGAMEVGAYLSQVAGRQAVPVAGSLLATGVNRSLMLRFGAGVAGGAGALLSAASAFINASRTNASGDYKASHNYAVAGTLLTFSGISSIGGAFTTWRAALAARAGQQVAMRLVGGAVLRTSAAALIGASATGVGIVLLIAGVAWALYAASLEHDENEKFLDRSFFGRHKRSEGRFGGAPMDDADAWTAHGMGDEMLAMGALALGLSGEISNWEDNIFQRDVIHARILLGSWDPELHEVRYRLEAYREAPAFTGGRSPAGRLIEEGPGRRVQPEPLKDNPQVHELTIEREIDDRKYQAVRLVFALHNKGERDPIAQAEVWETD